MWDTKFFGTEKRPFTNKVTILWDMPASPDKQRDQGKQARQGSKKTRRRGPACSLICLSLMKKRPL